MAATLVRGGRVEILKDYLAQSAAALSLILIKEVAGLSDTTVFGDLAEANYSGYTNNNPVFPNPALDGANKASTTAPQLTFSHNGGVIANTIKGYALIEIAEPTDKLLFWEALPADRTMGAGGDTITVTPTLTLTQG